MLMFVASLVSLAGCGQGADAPPDDKARVPDYKVLVQDEGRREGHVFGLFSVKTRAGGDKGLLRIMTDLQGRNARLDAIETRFSLPKDADAQTRRAYYFDSEQALTDLSPTKVSESRINEIFEKQDGFIVDPAP